MPYTLCIRLKTRQVHPSDVQVFLLIKIPTTCPKSMQTMGKGYNIKVKCMLALKNDILEPMIILLKGIPCEHRGCTCREYRIIVSGFNLEHGDVARITMHTCLICPLLTSQCIISISRLFLLLHVLYSSNPIVRVMSSEALSATVNHLQNFSE